MTIHDLLAYASSKLQGLSIERPHHEARLLLEIALDWPIEKIIAYPEEIIEKEDEEVFHKLLERRLAYEPISKIRGYRDFWKDRFFVTRDTLDPRSDSETLIEVTLNTFQSSTQPTIIVEAGVGTGCLILSLLKEFPDAIGFGVDINPRSLKVFQRNIIGLGLEERCFAIQGSWCDALKPSSADLVISNPPYIPTAELETLEKEVRDYDPRIALDGGEEGLEAYRELIPQVTQILKPRGKIVLEVGINEAEKVTEILENSGYYNVEIYKDLKGIDRCISANFLLNHHI